MKKFFLLFSVYDTTNCDTPRLPPLCKVVEHKPRFPCTRYVCSTPTSPTTIATTTETTRTPLALKVGVGIGAINSVNFNTEFQFTSQSSTTTTTTTTSETPTAQFLSSNHVS